MSHFRFSSVSRIDSRETYTELLKYQEVLELFDSQFPRYLSREITETILTVDEYYSTAHELVDYEITKIKITLFANRLVLIATKSRITMVTSFQLSAPEYPREKRVDLGLPRTLFGALTRISSFQRF